MDNYEAKIREVDFQKQIYENKLKNYLQEKKQNEIDVDNYKKELETYEKKKENFIIKKTKEICSELGINYDNFKKWDITDKFQYRSGDNDYNHTKEEKRKLKDIVDDKLKPLLEKFVMFNEEPKRIYKLSIPEKPSLPNKPDLEKDRRYLSKKDDGYEAFEKCEKIESMYYLPSASTLKDYKNKYEDKYEREYEKNFNEHYEKYREQYYRSIIKKHFDKYNIYICKTNENYYRIEMDICHYSTALCCEIKPTIGDDYPCVLRKLTAQIELTNNDKTKFEYLTKKYILIIGSFTSISVTREQLITIFKQSNISIVFTEEIFGSPKLDKIKYINTENKIVDNTFLEEYKILKDNLLQAQHKLLQIEEKLLQTEEKLLQTEEKNKKLEDEILSLKNQKQPKSIKDYFGKK